LSWLARLMRPKAIRAARRASLPKNVRLSRGCCGPWQCLGQRQGARSEPLRSNLRRGCRARRHASCPNWPGPGHPPGPLKAATSAWPPHRCVPGRRGRWHTGHRSRPGRLDRPARRQDDKGARPRGRHGAGRPDRPHASRPGYSGPGHHSRPRRRDTGRWPPGCCRPCRRRGRHRRQSGPYRGTRHGHVRTPCGRRASAGRLGGQGSHRLARRLRQAVAIIHHSGMLQR